MSAREGDRNALEKDDETLPAAWRNRGDGFCGCGKAFQGVFFRSVQVIIRMMPFLVEHLVILKHLCWVMGSPT